MLATAGLYVYAADRADQAFLRLEALRRTEADDGRAGERVRAEQQFLGAWYSYASKARRLTAWDWLEQDRTLATTAERRERLTQHWREIQTDGQRIAESDPARAYKLCASFLDEFADAPQKQYVRELQLAGAPRLAGRRPQARDEANPKDHRAYAAALNDFLAIPGISTDEKESARGHLSKLEEDWDRVEYEALLNEFRRGVVAKKPVNDPDILETVDRLAADYLSSPRQFKAMAPAATTWRNWFASLKTERRLHDPREGGPICRSGATWIRGWARIYASASRWASNRTGRSRIKRSRRRCWKTWGRIVSAGGADAPGSRGAELLFPVEQR